jgi:DNA-binding transcriptional ArsR family regulator
MISSAGERVDRSAPSAPVGEGRIGSRRSPVSAPDALTRTFAALADPTRRSILARLAEGEATVNELADPFSMSQQAISKHIQVLERAGLVTRTRRAQYRPCRLEPEPLDDAVSWIARHRQMWADRFDQLDEYLTAIRDGDDAEEEPT